ncbi:DUF3899 domain-containing protein [Chengkuizengella axinellae]|uniref:DUF3899 domain-containing protein n=1 Tax=Chengkuizengella axinellae TaxID=3064388 RepID=A0ABT9J1P4_9BACL|nr:DUF3899 domain-containing protein [Chengkuizengella sp. 2205SS18-9]MDP5275539.1 DUF3899 domain-containing protein [Chengkuizengella sp. 2205SS18-9]
MNLQIKLRILTPTIVFLICGVYSFLFYDKSVYQTLINTTFMVGIFCLSLSAVVFVSNGWFKPVYKFIIRRKKPSKEELDESLVNYQVDANVLNEREIIKQKKQHIRKESMLLPLITAIPLIITSIVLLLL